MHYVACRGSMRRKTTSLTVLPVVLSSNAFFPTYHVLQKGKETIGFFRPTEQKLSLQQPNNCIKYRGSPFCAVFGSPGNRTIRNLALTVFLI